MTPEQTAAGEVVATEIRDGYADQLVEGSSEQLGHRWHPLANLPPERRAEEIARRMASPLVDRFRDPSFDPATADSPLKVALRQQSHKLADGAVDRLSSEWAADFAGRDPARTAGEVARRVNHPSNGQHLRVRPEAPAHEDRVYTLLSANFDDVLSVDGKMALVQERGREFAQLSDDQIVMTVAGSLRSSVVAERYGATETIQTGDLRLRGIGQHTTPARTTATPPAKSAPTRESDGRFTSGTSKPRDRRMSF